MEMDVDTGKLHNIILRLCGPEEGTALLGYVNSSSEIRLSELIYRMISAGADRRAILSELRRLRISDSEIADAFAGAVKKIATGAKNEKAE
ncbi:MAG: hypothetical protein M1520_01960 [Candidatus Marsarchaeota archaeon]|jgi:hypothetical protein|nr:hypothetical protein [Candidatus Marsarchaeota archaeon]